MTMNRRQFFHASLASALLLPLPFRASAQRQRQPLRIPPLLKGELKQGVRHYALAAQTGISEFVPGMRTPTWGYNGAFLGPTLNLKRGESVAIEVKNLLQESTTVHWHGMILPASSDGGPHQAIAPGKSWTARFEVRQPAATLFYHSHEHGKTGEQVYRGLAGVLRLQDEAEAELGLPSEYGVDDIPVVLTDRAFNEDGSFSYLTRMPDRMIGKHGHNLLVNGTYAPEWQAQTKRLRLRLVNASNARFYDLGFSDERPFQVIASDGGLLRQPLTQTRLTLAPAERYEIVVELSAGQDAVLRDFGGVGNTTHGPLRRMGMGSGFDEVLMIRSGGLKAHAAGVPEQLIAYADLPESLDQERDFTLQMGMGRGGNMSINGQAFDMQRIDFEQTAQQWERWRIENNTPMQHPFHIHNTQFRVQSRNGQAVGPLEQGYKDTVIVPQRETVELLLPTGPYSDSRLPYMYHCHILEHEDAGMMGQFMVQPA